MEKTAVVQARLDYVTIASVAKYFTLAGQRPQSKSDLVWKAVELLAAVLEGNGKMERIPSLFEAYHFMQEIGMADLHVGGRNRRAFSKQLNAEDIRANENELTLERMRFKGVGTEGQELMVSPEEMFRMMNEARDIMGHPRYEEIPSGVYKGWRPPEAEPPRMKISEEELQKQLKIARSAPNALRVDSDDSAPISSEAFAQREAEVLAQLRGSLAAPMAQAPTLKEEE